MMFHSLLNQPIFPIPALFLQDLPYRQDVLSDKFHG